MDKEVMALRLRQLVPYDDVLAGDFQQQLLSICRAVAEAAVIQDRAARAELVTLKKIDCIDLDYKYVCGWNDCLAAMLAAAPKPEQQEAPELTDAKIQEIAGKYWPSNFDPCLSEMILFAREVIAAYRARSKQP